ncbi:MAG: hypothetical protein AAGN64_13730 [Bacteroidota bacterium]
MSERDPTILYCPRCGAPMLDSDIDDCSTVEYHDDYGQPIVKLSIACTCGAGLFTNVRLDDFTAY